MGTDIARVARQREGMKIQTASPQIAASAMMVGAMATFGVIDNYVGRLAQEIGLWQFQFTRTVLMIPLIWLMVRAGLGGLRPVRWKALALRSALVGLAMVIYFASLGLLSIAQALAGLFTSPIFVLLISLVVLRQRIGPWRVLAVGMGFVGILLVLRPDPVAFDIKVLLPMAAGLFYAMGTVATRTLCAEESTVALLAGVMLVQGVGGGLALIGLEFWPQPVAEGAEGFLWRGWVWPMWQAAPYVALQAVGSVLAVFLTIRAYQIGEPSYVSVFEYSVMIFGPAYAFAVLGQGLDLPQILGIGLIALAGGIIAVRSN